MKTLWDREPVMILALVQSGLALALAFGAHLTVEQVGAIIAFFAALLGFITRQHVTSPAALSDMSAKNLAAAQNTAPPVAEIVKQLP